MNPNTPVILQTGFRLFFLSAIIFAVVSMAQWSWQLYVHHDIGLQHIGRAQWHAHEMVFGYAVAVISGFLLILISQILWIGAYILMLVYFLPNLTRPRVDGQYG